MASTQPMTAAASSAGANACAGIAPEDREAIARIAGNMVAGHGLGVRAVERIGRVANAALDRTIGWLLPDGRDTLEDIASEALWSLFGAARTGLGAVPGEDRPLVHRGIVTASGAVAGFAGGPLALAEIPFAMAMMFRAIALVARRHGEDLDDTETRRACLEVFGFGTLRAATAAEEEVEASYWAVRAALTHAPLRVFIRAVAARFSVVVSDQALATATPVIGALAGSSVNLLFMRHFQTMADIHFTLRALERKYGDAERVRACFDHAVAEARARRHLFRRHG